MATPHFIYSLTIENWVVCTIAGIMNNKCPMNGCIIFVCEQTFSGFFFE